MTRTRGITEQAADAAIDTACHVLRLPTIWAQFADAAGKAEQEQLSYLAFLAELFLAELEDRDHRRAERRLRAAGFPRQKWLNDFDFDANPSTADDKQLTKTIARYGRVDLLCIDELGYMELDRRGATHWAGRRAVSPTRCGACRRTG